jgi:hypothetical protein
LTGTRPDERNTMTSKERGALKKEDTRTALAMLEADERIAPARIAGALHGTPQKSSQWPRHRVSDWERGLYVTRLVEPFGWHWPGNRWQRESGRLPRSFTNVKLLTKYKRPTPRSGLLERLP